ncbi:MAG TPA: putative peptidoglycan glycosyltransferase FtsW [Candidatus Gracilibacteria bacterium]|nr:putative peptidoglycan glycosyltransferase FtsW [Candidatus Gracilibacteria bacterium]
MKSLLKADNILALAVFLLLIFGLVMITSIGVPKSIDISAPGVLYPNCSDPNVDCYLLFKKHLVRLILGFGAFFFAFFMPIKFWKKIAIVLFFAMVGFLFFIAVAGNTYGTFAKSWIVISGTSLQPTEFAKLALIIYLAHFFESKKSKISDFKEGFLPFVLMSALIAVPVLMQPDLGSTLVIGVIAVAMYFVAGANLKHLLIGAGVAILLSIVLIAALPHVRERFTSFTRTDEECIEDACWQSRQANIAVGSGGIFGKGLTQGMQKSYWLPQATDDFIFAASAEELGFIRIVFIIIAFFIIAKRGIYIANNARSNFEILLATGLTTWIVMQAFINIAVNTALMPVTGITLPFVSYGGSSLLASMVAVGILLSISTENNNNARSLFGRRDIGTHHSKPRRYRRF